MVKSNTASKKGKPMNSILADTDDNSGSRMNYGLQGRRNNLGREAEEERTVKSPKL